MAEFQFDLRDLYRILRRRKWVVLSAPVLVAAVTYFLSGAPPRLYTAEARVKISRVASNMQALLIEALSWYQGDNIETQSRIITSQRIRVGVAQRLSRKFAEFRAVPPTSSVEDVLADRATMAVVDSMSIIAERVGDSDIVGITATASSGELAVEVANATAQTFIQYNIGERNRQVREAVQFIRLRMSEVSKSLEEAEHRRKQFREENADVLGLQSTDSYTLRSTLDSLDRRIRTLTKVIAQLANFTTAQRYLTEAPSAADLRDPVIAQLESQLLTLIGKLEEAKSRRRQLLLTRTEEAAEVRKNAVEVEDLQRNLTETTKACLERYRGVLLELTAERDALRERLGQIALVPEYSRELEALQRAVTMQTEALSDLRKKLQDAEVQQAGEIQEISLVEAATGASLVPQHSKLFKAAIGLVIGILLGGLLAFVMESLDTSIGTIEDVERFLQVPVLGVIPHQDHRVAAQNIQVDQAGSALAPEDIENMSTLCAHFSPRASIAEAFRSLRAHVESVVDKNNWKTLMVTSSVLQEGKTSTACNLAVVFAQSGRRTLLIDADLRRPQINKILGVARSPGLSDVLLGVSEWENAVRSIDDLILGKYGLKNAHLNPGLEYLYFLSSGSRVDHPAELLGLDMLARIMTQLRDRYDIIVMDVAPVLPVADPSIVAPIVDATLLVYQIGRVGREVVNRSKARLDGLGANVVGVVMNDIEAEIDYLQDYALYAYRYGYEEAGRAGGRAGVLGRLKSGLSSALFGRSGKSAGRSPSKRS